MHEGAVHLSVCLTTYNRARLLSECLDAVLAQTYRDFELIISDDSSTDDTEAVCRHYEARDSRVKYFKNERNLHMPGNLNAALRRTSPSKYVAILHDHDVYRPDMLEKWIAALEKYPTAAFVFNHYEILDSNGRPTGRIDRPFDAELIPGRTLMMDCIERQSCPVSAIVMIRRSALDEIGEFDQRFGFISDVDMSMRLAALYDVACVQEPLVGIRTREPDHFLNQIRWEHERLREDLFLTNIRRVFGEPDGDNNRIWHAFFRAWDAAVFRGIAGAICRFNQDSLKSSMQYLKVSKSPRLASIGRLLKRVGL